MLTYSYCASYSATLKVVYSQAEFTVADKVVGVVKVVQPEPEARVQRPENQSPESQKSRNQSTRPDPEGKSQKARPSEGLVEENDRLRKLKK